MGKFTDFFKALASNADVMDDKYIEKELQAFMAENAASAKRVSTLENRLRVDIEKRTTRSKTIVNQVETPKKQTSDQKDNQERDEKER